ncbi:MAG TPA: type I-B CRISPR-associated protein Cas7/Csh2 [Candidatus Atribacteria bacterium]|nr:type I-B CRISPR-associated protein Cas7/Csh2 [Candidatus Atribacteria bacterium]
MSNHYSRNSDFLFIYDAKMCNPNGDPDDENKPRMDYATKTNLVSDVRLKRYIRDYLQGLGHQIFVSKVDDKTVNATERLKRLFENFEENGKKGGVDINKLEDKHIKWILSQLIDVRMFGVTMPIKAKQGTQKGSSTTFTGPIQINWGYSLNKVDLVESSSITSHFSSETTKEQGAMGKDWRVYYSLIAFHGIISGKRAEKTNLSEDDVKLFDNAIIEAIPLEATTRSKIGQTPRLYLRLEYQDDKTFLGDLRRYVSLEEKESLRDIEDVKLDFSKLKEKAQELKNEIEKIYLWVHPDLKEMASELSQLNNGHKFELVTLPHKIEP